MQATTERVRVLRAFYFNGKPTKVGEVVEVPTNFARELAAYKRAEILVAKAEEKPKPEDKPKAEAKKGDKDAR